MAGMMGWNQDMTTNTQSSLMQAGIQGAQNTSRQENMQRQALFQNLVGAMDDSEWLRQHYPNFYGWTPSGGGGGGYEAGAVAPMMPAASNFNMPSSGRGSEQSGYTPINTKPVPNSKPEPSTVQQYANTNMGRVVRAPDDYYKGNSAQIYKDRYGLE